MLETHYGVFAWNYWWGLTSAQIELGLIDQPFIDYDADKKKEKKHTRKEMDELARKWLEMKKENEGKSVADGWKAEKIDDIIKSDNV